jgi:hypothetical protein
MQLIDFNYLVLLPNMKWSVAQLVITTCTPYTILKG